MNNDLKKWLAALLCGAMMVSSLAMVACDGGDNTDTSTETESVTQTETDIPTETETIDESATKTETETDAPQILNGKTPAQVYVENMTAFKQQGNTASAVMDVKYFMNIGGVTSETSMQMTLEGKIKGDDVYSKTSTPDGMGGTYVTEEWYVGGYVYTEDYDENFELIKVKVAATPEEAKDYYGISGESIPVPEAWWTDVTFTEDGENYVFTITADKAMIDANSDELDLGDFVEDGAEITSMIMTCVVNAQGVIVSDTLVLEMSMDEEGMAVSVEMTANTTYSDIGTTVVEAPADAADYVESELPSWEEYE